MVGDWNCIRIELSGDGTKVGTKVGRSIHVVNFTFTLVDRPTAESLAGNYTLAILRTGEDYFDLAAGLQHITQEIKDLSHIKVNGEQYMIEYFMGGDWKFPAVVCGLNAANSDYSCVWCKCPSGDHWDMKKEWSVSDTTKWARTIEEIKSLSKQPHKKCIKTLIFSSIPIDHIIIDTLHFFLRIADLLINLLIIWS